MNLIEQSHKIWGISPSSYDEAMLWVERAARNCYASQDKIKPGSAEKLIDGIMKSDPPHSSVLEHVSIYAVGDVCLEDIDDVQEIFKSKWINQEYDGHQLTVFGNLRAFMETMHYHHPRQVYESLNNNDFKLIDNATVPDFAKRITVELTTDRAVLAEITRHRADVAFSVESQRYVNYDEGVTFIKPSWYDEADPQTRMFFDEHCEDCERDYKLFRARGLSPQHSRTVLNQQVKTTIVMSAYLPEWEWIFKLRTGPGVYPQMINLISGVKAEFKERGW